MVQYRYLGYGYTNSQGVATLNFDPSGEPLSHSYTGVGAGKVDVVAMSGGLQSDPYVIWDTLWFDNGVNGDYNENVIISGSPSISRNADGTTITAQNNEWANYRPSNDGTNFLSYHVPIVVEYDLVNVSTDSRIEIYNSTSTRTQTTFSNYNNPTGHYKHEVGLTSQKVYKDGNLIQTTYVDFSEKNFRVDVMVWNNKSITFKNMKVYNL